MGRILHWDIVEGTINSLCTKDKLWASVLGECLWKMQAGLFGNEYMDIIVQKPWRRHGHGYDLIDAYCFLQVHAMLHRFDALVTEIVIGRSPTKDCFKDEINSILSQIVLFEAEFWGGLQSRSDGYFAWIEPLWFGQTNGDGVTQERIVQPSRVPLEVGYTESTTSLFHLIESGGLARWPYNHETIYLLVVVADGCSVSPKRILARAEYHAEQFGNPEKLSAKQLALGL